MANYYFITDYGHGLIFKSACTRKKELFDFIAYIVYALQGRQRPDFKIITRSGKDITQKILEEYKEENAF